MRLARGRSTQWGGQGGGGAARGTNGRPGGGPVRHERSRVGCVCRGAAPCASHRRDRRAGCRSRGARSSRRTGRHRSCSSPRSQSSFCSRIPRCGLLPAAPSRAAAAAAKQQRSKSTSSDAALPARGLLRPDGWPGLAAALQGRLIDRPARPARAPVPRALLSPAAARTRPPGGRPHCHTALADARAHPGHLSRRAGTEGTNGVWRQGH